MVKRLGFVIAAGASACGVANAQGPSPFYVRGGATWPYSASTASVSSHYGFSVGLGYILGSSGLKNPGGTQSAISFDFGHVGGSGHIETYDLEYIERFNAMGKLYFGLGGGLRVAKFATEPAAPAGGGSSGGVFRPNDFALFGSTDDTQTTVVGELLVGVGLAKNIALEASAKIAPSYHTESTTGVSLLLKFRF